ncbi:hypothetical protein ACVOMV_36740 [Mesorhizobium atlanticum]
MRWRLEDLGGAMEPGASGRHCIVTTLVADCPTDCGHGVHGNDRLRPEAHPDGARRLSGRVACRVDRGGGDLRDIELAAHMRRATSGLMEFTSVAVLVVPPLGMFVYFLTIVLTGMQTLVFALIAEFFSLRSFWLHMASAPPPRLPVSC